MVFHWRLSDSKSPQVSRTLLSILAVFNNVVWMVSTRPPTSKSSRPFSNPLVTVPKAPITIGIIVIVIFLFYSKVKVLISLFTFFQFYSVVLPVQQSRQFCRFSFFLLIIVRSGLLAEIRWSVCMSKSHWSLCVSFSRTGAWLRIYHLLVWSNLNFLHISQWITLPTQSCLALYSFCANLLHLVNYVNDSFISVTAQPTFAVLLSLIYPRLDMIGSYGAVLCCHQERFCFSLKVSWFYRVRCFLLVV